MNLATTEIASVIEKAEAAGGNSIELLRQEFGPQVVFFEFLDPGWGPKDPQVLTLVIDMGGAAVAQD